jgi:hypothetical protein
MFTKLISLIQQNARQDVAPALITLTSNDVASVSGGCTESAGTCHDTGNGHIVCEGARICASK